MDESIKTEERTKAEKFEGAQDESMDIDSEKANDEDVGTYFIDEEGQIYFQPNATNENEEVEETKKVQVDNNEEKNVETEDGEEVRYVYIVEEGEEDENEGAREENDLTVYDFNEDNDENAPEQKGKDVTPKKSHSVSKIMYNCPHCEYSNPKKVSLHNHMKTHSSKKPYKCSICAKDFKSVVGLNNHENTHTGTKPYRCRICDAKFTTSGEIVRHVRYKHTKLRPHKCNECNYAAVELSKLRRHQRSHTGERPYQCPHCTYASPDTFKLKRHLRVHTGERPYKCDICSMAFSQSNSLKAHRLTHFPEERPVFQCALCPITCARKADLRGHIRKLHTANKPYECKRCGKHLPDKYTYNVHLKSHTGEKSYKCDFCAYASVSKLHLESHMFIHTDEKPYECDECDYRSRQKQLLKRHKNIYHNPDFVPPEPAVASHECDVCHKKFIHIGNLIKHLAVHDPDSSFHEKKEALRMGRRRKVDFKHQSSSQENVSNIKRVDDYDDEEGHYIVFEIDGEEEEEQSRGDKTTENVDKTIDVKTDMKNCFGFDEEEEED